MVRHQEVWSEMLARISRFSEYPRMACRGGVIVGWAMTKGRTVAMSSFVMFPELSQASLVKEDLRIF